MPMKLIYSKHLNNENLSALDIRFITELTKGTIRMSKRIEYEIANHYNGKIKKLEKLYLIILKSAIYQLDYMSRVPDYAIVSTSVDITKKLFPKYSKLTNALLRSMISNRKKIEKPDEKSSSEYLAIYYSHPEWLIDKWKCSYSFKSLIKLLDYNNQTPTVWFRYDTNRININNLKIELKNKNLEIKKNKYLNNFFRIDNPSELLNSKVFEEGGILVQSPVNGLIIKLLDPLPDECITDLCAAPGGKTVAISQHVLNKGTVLSYDINKKRVDLITQNLNKHKIKNVKLELKDVSKDKLSYSSKMIADVPCLGTGTISKNVDLKWKKRIDDLIRLTNLQEQILNNSSKYLKPNGVIVYSTCSIEEEENWMVVDRFLKNHPNYIIDNAEKYIDSKFIDSRGAINIKPQKHNLDGGFAVRLINYEK